MMLTATALPPNAGAGFAELAAGARPMGMANAHAALADDADALVFNPAGLASLARPQLAATYGRLFLGLDDGSNISDNFLAYAHPLRGGRGTFAAGLFDLRLAGFYEERTLSLAYARPLRGGLSAGAALKLLRKSYSIGSDPRLAGDPLFRDHGTAASGIGVDFGATLKAAEPLTLALVLTDANEPDLGLKDPDPIPRGIKAGAAYRRAGFGAASDLVLRGGDWDFLFGSEKWIFGGAFAGRVGLGFGSRGDRDISTGASFWSDNLRIDYAFQLPLSGIAGTAGTHRFTLGVAFGAPGESEYYRGDPVRKPTELEIKLRSLDDELEKSRKDNEKTLEILERLEKNLSRPAPPPRPSPAPKPSPKKSEVPKVRPKIYRVDPGDTLKSIAAYLYGDPARWVDIYKVNQDRIGPGGRLTPGQTLAIP